MGAITPQRVFVTTLLNPKALVFALGVIPFDVERPAAYLAAFLAMTAGAACAWTAAGAALGRMLAHGSLQRFVPRVSAAVLALFALIIVGTPLLQ